MVIESYKVNTAAQRTYVKAESESVQITTGGGGVRTQISLQQQAVVAAFSQTAQQMLQASGPGGETAKEATRTDNASETQSTTLTAKDPIEMKLEMLRQFVYQLTGRRINILTPEGLLARGRSLRLAGLAMGGEIRYEKSRFESEAVSFKAQGEVKTADGKTINIDMQLNMSRSFYESTSASLRWGSPGGQLVDPLVINYGGKAASLTQRKFSFDLDVDGQMDQISFAGAGSGFLALDKDGDGKIGDGSELFGPQSGNGFADLRTHDTDGNGWIDEADDVFAKLRVWSKDEQGNDQMFTLKELGLGAIYLGETETQFQMNDTAGQMQGQMRSTSFFLRENGSAGYLHHIDLLA